MKIKLTLILLSLIGLLFIMSCDDQTECRDKNEESNESNEISYYEIEKLIEEKVEI